MVSFHKNVVSLVIASSALCAKSMVLMDPTSTSTGTLPRTFINKDIKTPDPVPEEGHKLALDLMKTGRMYRYNIGKGEESVVSQCEIDLAAYTGHKYCVALNSCGSAIMLMMKCAGLQPGDEVLSNAFTFGAVPSAIEHAGGKVRLDSFRNLKILNLKYFEILKYIGSIRRIYRRLLDRCRRLREKDGSLPKR